MIRSIAIDDEPLALELMAAHCARIEGLKLERCFTSTREARDYLASFPVDLLFLDVQMPDISGLDFYRTLTNPPLLILTTAHPEFAVEGFNVSAVDFLLKPILFDRLSEAVSKAAMALKTRNPVSGGVIAVRSEYALVRISQNDISYIETLDDYLKIHLRGKAPVLTLMSLKAMMEMLPADDFQRVHRSYIVSLNTITAVRGRTIFIEGAEIPISRSFEKEFFRVYTRSFH